MFIGEPFEIAMMMIKRPGETFARFAEKPPKRQMITLCLTIWLAVSSYIFSYLGLEFYQSKVSHFVIYSSTALLSVIFVFMLLAMLIYFNARLLFGEGNLGAIFTCVFYAFLAVVVYLALPLQLMSFVLVPPEYEYWFTVITRPFVALYFSFLVVTATAKVFRLSAARSVAAFVAIFAYAAFFVFSVVYISKKYNIPLY